MSKTAFVVSWKVKPGRIEEFLKAHTEGQKQMTAAPGSPSYTVWGTLSGPGEEPNSMFTVVLEFASAAAHGQFMDAMTGDPKTYLAMMNSYFGENPPAIELGTSTALEVPLG